jgi:hypothetical protein
VLELPVAPMPVPEPEDVCAATKPTPPTRRAAESRASAVFMKIFPRVLLIGMCRRKAMLSGARRSCVGKRTSVQGATRWVHRNGGNFAAAHQK